MAGRSSSSSSLAALACLLVALVAATPAATAAPLDQKETHLRVYWHDMASGNATVVTVAKAASTNTSTTRFSSVQVMDDALTLGPNLTTSNDIIGRAEGIYVSDSIETSSVMMAMNFVFIKGPYANSSIAIFGPNFILRKVREMSVIGGTGVFRFARGYVEARTQWLNPSTGDAIVKYDIFVRHDL